MIYIALAFLDGILLIYNKPLAYMLASLLLFIITKRKLPILLTIVILCQPIISYTIFSSHISNKSQKLMWFKTSKPFKGHLMLQHLQIKKEKYAESKVKIRDFPVKLTYFPKNPAEINKLKGMTANVDCYIEGQFKVDPDFNDAISLIVKKIDYASCKPVKSHSLESLIAQHKFYSLHRLKLYSPHWQNTFAMITGDVSFISPSELETDKELGIYHLLAVSSSHVVVIASIFYFVFNRLSIPLIFIKFIIITVLLLFAYYTDFAPSALRAILCMSLVMILPKKFYHSLIDILCTVFLFLCIVNPDIVLDIGFQFSFLITCFILLSSPALKNKSALFTMFIMTLIAQFGSFLISAYHFNQIQWIGFVSNFIFIPFYSFILFPLAIFTYFYYQWLPSNTLLNLLIVKLYAIHDQLLIPLFKYLVRFRWFIGEMNSFLIVMTLVWLIILLVLTTNTKIKAALILFVAGSVVLTYIASIPHTRFTALNVGQGDAFLFETRHRDRILIDTGGKAQNENQLFDFNSNDSNDSHSISKFHILPTLRKRGISTLDYVIVTHPHADHIGELHYVMTHVHVKNLIVNFKSFPVSSLMQLHGLCHQNKTQLIDVNTIKSIRLGENKITFYDTALTQSKDLNDHSIIALIQIKKYNILTTGDATAKNENLLLQKYKLSKIDILKVGHHGSQTSNSVTYINTVHPTYSIISSGKNNVYKLPNKTILKRLKGVRSMIYDTQINGEVTFNLDHNIEVITQNQ